MYAIRSYYDLTATTIYVRLKAGLTVNSYNSEIITNAGGGAPTVNISCNGYVSAVPPAVLSVNTVITSYSIHYTKLYEPYIDCC